MSQQPGQQLEIENKGEAVEIIAVELQGKHLEAFALQLPAFPLLLKKGGRLTIPVAAKPGSKASGPVTFRLETVLGPVKDFALTLEVI